MFFHSDKDFKAHATNSGNLINVAACSFVPLREIYRPLPECFSILMEISRLTPRRSGATIDADDPINVAALHLLWISRP